MWACVCDLVRENLETPGIWSVNSDPSLTNGVVLGKCISLSELLAMSLCVNAAASLLTSMCCFIRPRELSACRKPEHQNGDTAVLSP